MGFNQDFLNLLQSVKPFLGPTAKAATEMTLYLTDLLTSQPGQQALRAFSSISPKADAEIMPADAAASSLAGTNPFALFLILILLIFASQDYPQPSCPPDPSPKTVEQAEGVEEKAVAED